MQYLYNRLNLISETKEERITNSKSVQVSLALITMVLIFTFMAPVYASANETSINWFMKGYNLYNQEKFSDSLDAYNRALELNPKDSEAWNNKGIDLGLLGKYDDALSSFETAVALNDSYAEAWFNMGVIYDIKGDYPTAVQAYKRATEVDPSYHKAFVARNVDTDLLMGRSLSCACQDQLALV
jgi:Flp pilus assembly protein TadD, contains TPR repeats